MKNGLFLLTFAYFLSAGGILFAYSGGDGSAAAPYQIADANDLLELADTPVDYSGHFILTADIDMAGYGPYEKALIAPDISDDNLFQGLAFDGDFNGSGHVIRNLSFEPAVDSDYIGLFGYAAYYPYEAQIYDLGVENISIVSSGGHSSVGGLVGETYYGQIDRCYVTGSISLGDGCEKIGGLIGYTTAGELTDCYSQCTVTCGTNANKIGGFTGGCYGAEMFHNYSAGQITVGSDSTNVTGFLGINDNISVFGSNFYDMNLSNMEAGAYATGLTTVEMFSNAEFIDAGWGGEWKYPTRNYPMLSWQNYTIGLTELGCLAETWLTDSVDPMVVYPADYYQDGSIDMLDFQMLSKSWLSGQMLYASPEIFDGFETGDLSALDWSSNAVVPWQVVDAAPYEGIYCAQITGVPANKASLITLNIETAAGKIGFYYNITGSRSIYFQIDGGLYGVLSSTAGWSYAEYDVTEGTHTFNWMFYAAGGSETDVAQIDNVRIYTPD